MLALLLTIALAYLFGSIPFGLLLTRLAGLGDIRQVGSGNIGATNVLRTGNKALAAATLLLDAGKGAGAVALAARWAPDLAAAAALASVVGHVFPVWLGFKGGKGVATALGALLVLAWPAALAALATWLAVAAATRYSSLAALVGTALAPLYAYLVTRELALTLWIVVLAALIIERHRANIARLRRGEESRMSFR